MTLTIADVSEYQTVNWSAHVGAGNQAVIVRAYNGSRPDYKLAPNRSGFWNAGGKALGLYAYVTKGRDVAAQANGFCDALGQLRDGEFPIADFEEGNETNQGPRAAQWRQIVLSRLGVEPWIYSGAYFYRDRGLSNAGYTTTRTWIAWYGRSSRPTWPDHSMWQFSESYGPMPGVTSGTKGHDASYYYGTLDDLLATVRGGGGSPSGPVPFPGADKFGPGANNAYVTMLGTWLIAKGYGRFYSVGAGPRWSDSDHQATQQFQRDQGWTGSNADGIPGPSTWAKLQS